MATSRLEKIGTIYTRVNGLIESKAMKPQDIPLWYELYYAFPPKEEPTFARPAPNIPLRKIFYEEDKIRAEFHQKYKTVGTVNMFNNESRTLTQRFIECYNKLQEQGNLSSNELYGNAIDILKHDKRVHQELVEEPGNLTSNFKEAQAESEHKKPSVDIKSLFKE